MPRVTGIAFDGNNKKYYFSSLPNLSLQDKVVVETARGLEIGTIIEDEKEVQDSEIVGELKKVLRKATPKDLEDYEKNVREKPLIREKCKQLIEESRLEMKFIDAGFTLDRSKLIVYFSAEGRVDFRDLVKSIAQVYHTRIELRQIGLRDASKVIGGIGICGRVTCCSNFLGTIQNVTIKMAKNQNLSLNPVAISGLCGKLLCCISYEDEVYNSMREEDEITPNKNEEAEEEIITIETK